MLLNKEKCRNCDKTYIRQYTDVEDQPKPCPFCSGTHIRLLEENVDCIEVK